MDWEMQGKLLPPSPSFDGAFATETGEFGIMNHEGPTELDTSILQNWMKDGQDLWAMWESLNELFRVWIGRCFASIIEMILRLTQRHMDVPQPQ